MSVSTTNNKSDIEEFLQNTKDENDEQVKTLRSAKYKNKKKPEIIVFPEIKNKKNKNTGTPFSFKDVENFKQGL